VSVFTLDSPLYVLQTLGDMDALRDVVAYLRFKGVASTKYPLFSAVHGIAFEGRPAESLNKLRPHKAWRKRSKYPTFAPISVLVFVLALAIIAVACGAATLMSSAVAPPPPPPAVKHKGWFRARKKSA